MAKHWYVVHAYSNFEAKVKASLEEHARLAGMEDMFGQILIPTEEVVEIRDGVKRRSERKFFPGYVLVEMEMNDETWHLVKDVPKVMGFIGGTKDKPAPITEKEAMNIINAVAEGDFNGVVEEVDYDRNRLKVAVLIFGRSTPVDLEFSQVEKG
jgi:transcriptional antiterminator NusG